jgi:predicted ATPase
LETQFHKSVAAQPERLVYHLTAAGKEAQARPCWLQAGQRTIERTANVEAIRHLMPGLTLLTTLPEMSVWLQQALTFSVTLGGLFS